MHELLSTVVTFRAPHTHSLHTYQSELHRLHGTLPSSAAIPHINMPILYVRTVFHNEHPSACTGNARMSTEIDTFKRRLDFIMHKEKEENRVVVPDGMAMRPHGGGAEPYYYTSCEKRWVLALMY